MLSASLPPILYTKVIVINVNFFMKMMKTMTVIRREEGEVMGILLITCSAKALQELRPGSREEACDGKVGRKECQEELAQGKALKCY